jgi:O-methyltransferase
MERNELNKIVAENTIISPGRIHMMEHVLKAVREMPGNAAEVGVLQGGSAFLAAHILDNKHVFLFDTFVGLTDDVVDAVKDKHKAGVFAQTTLEHVQSLFKDVPNVSIHEGVFPKVNREVVEDETFCYVHLDCDVYYSVKEGLDFFYPRLVKDGLIVLDDYGCPYCTGVHLAVAEFLEENPGSELRHLCECQFAIVNSNG